MASQNIANALATAHPVPPGPGARSGNPTESMRMTWRTGDRRQWIFHQRMIQMLNLFPTSLTNPPPQHSKSDKMPVVPDWQIHRWVIWHAGLPMLLHELYVRLVYAKPSTLAVGVYYTLAFVLIGIHQINILRKMGERYGFLDGDAHDRDGIPDTRVKQIMRSLNATVSFRMLLTVCLCYNRHDGGPISATNWRLLPIEIATYGIVLDFWFYWYHRAMHHHDRLWIFHRTHHLTKHPNALLSLFADSEQEVFDIVGIPLLAYISLTLLGLHMGFFDWWICHQYVVFAELTGHSGLRVHTTPPTPISWLLEYFEVELVIEDHDLHHRKGWKKSYNYGKHCRIWDRLFGTMAPRIESARENIDTNAKANWPVFWM